MSLGNWVETVRLTFIVICLVRWDDHPEKYPDDYHQYEQFFETITGISWQSVKYNFIKDVNNLEKK